MDFVEIIDMTIGWVFRFWAYVFFGFVMEIKVTAILKLTDGDITADDRKLHGQISLWMIPVYGILLLAIFEPVYTYTSSLHFIWRHIIWSISFTFFETLAGWIYDRFLNVRPWDYREDWGSLFNGYTKLTYIPLWGAAGLIIEQYSNLMVYLSPHVVNYIRALF